MNKQTLVAQIKSKKSFLCVGLDPDITKIPNHLLGSEDPIFEFNKAIIDATHEYCVSYKPNMAFYEAQGLEGWKSLDKTINYLNEKYPNHFTIADAKRGDIGNTSAMYAKAFLEKMKFDSITVAPYMGSDSVKPFLTVANKWVIVLALTSNEGALDFQFIKGDDHKQLFEHVLETSKNWGSDENMMYVVGATKAESLTDIRKIVPNHFLLVPGVGAQGGSLQEVCKYGFTKDCGLLINASRSILYASSGTDFAEKAAEEAKNMQQEMKGIMKQLNFS
ncbi:MAG: orotidine-5'-phosphate decarboxylase [Bacteroidota bacterium]|nr:orotidine-5'-phosphate decarboxylase [Bacteroidota bacterium]